MATDNKHHTTAVLYTYRKTGKLHNFVNVDVRFAA